MSMEDVALASRGKRLGGAMIDGLIGMAVGLPLMIATGIWERTMQGEPMGFGDAVVWTVVGLILFLLIHGYLLAKHGQTVGKKLVGIRIVSHADGSILPFNRVFGLRYLPVSLVTLIPLIGNLLVLVDALFIFGKERRCLHDLLAGTTVVNAVSVPQA